MDDFHLLGLTRPHQILLQDYLWAQEPNGYFEFPAHYVAPRAERMEASQRRHQMRAAHEPSAQEARSTKQNPLGLTRDSWAMLRDALWVRENEPGEYLQIEISARRRSVVEILTIYGYLTMAPAELQPPHGNWLVHVTEGNLARIGKDWDAAAVGGNLDIAPAAQATRAQEAGLHLEPEF